jgi:hypothetical protein
MTKRHTMKRTDGRTVNVTIPNDDQTAAILADALQRTLWEIAKRDGEGNVIPPHALRVAFAALKKCGFYCTMDSIRALGLDAYEPLAFRADP